MEEDKDIVPFELAKVLAEKEFPQFNSHVSYYVGDGKPPFYSIGTVIYGRKYDWDTHLIAAPTIAQVLKWLREEKKLHVSIMTFMFKEGWCFEIIQIGQNPKLVATQRNSFNIYEQAAIAGIEYVVENLI